MAINPNNQNTAEHTLYCGTTSSGKTTAVKKLGRLPNTKNTNILFFDPFGDYHDFNKKLVNVCTTKNEFVEFLEYAVDERIAFKICFSPENASLEDFLFFCEMAWQVANGDEKLHLVFEEVSNFTQTIGKDDTRFGDILRTGRKYGIVAHIITQRIQEIPKTVSSQCSWLWVGRQNSQKECKYLEDLTGIKKEELIKLEPFEYFIKGPGADNFTKGKLKSYK